MLLFALALQAAAEPAPPSAEALQLGRQLAERGMLAAMLPIVIEKDLTDLAAEDSTLTAPDRDALFAIGREQAATASARLMDQLGRGYAAALSVEDLRVLVEQAAHPATARHRAAEPQVIAGAMGTIGEVDLKKNVAAALCTQRERLCDRD